MRSKIIANEKKKSYNYIKNKDGNGEKLAKINKVVGFIDSIIGKAIVVGVELHGRDKQGSMEESLAELKELARAANIDVAKVVKQKLNKIKVGTYLGSGKLDEIKMMSKIHGADILLVDDELSGIQIRNMEAYLDMEIIDRTSLILDIFATRAKTKEGKLQVELARLKYAKPREIGGMGIALSRQGGGIGTRGLGEKKLEIDKRNISKRISDVEKAIEDVKKQREVQRNKRQKSHLPTISLVGYTNSGKSTLMNHFIRENNPLWSKHESPAEDMLFATLDPFHRKITLKDNLEFILADTVGFVSKLPHSLVDAFMSTLEEVREADLLLYILDISNDDYELQLRVTQEVIKELQADDKPYIIVENKSDRLEEGVVREHSEVFATSVRISALTGDGVDDLIHEIEKKLLINFTVVEMLIPFSEGRLASYIMDKTKVLDHEYQGDGLWVRTNLNEHDAERYKKFIK